MTDRLRSVAREISDLLAWAESIRERRRDGIPIPTSEHDDYDKAKADLVARAEQSQGGRSA